MSNQKTFSIYTLSCPKTGAVRYVGATSQSPKDRLRVHKNDAKIKKSSPAHKWINSLLDEGLEPIMDIIDKGDADTWQAKEKRWIQWHKDNGCDLLNQTDGGLNCKMSDETRRKNSELRLGENNVWYGKHHSEESRRKQFESQPHRRPVIQYTKNKVFVRNWDGITRAGVELGISPSDITQCCKRKPSHYSAGGYIWRYATDPIPQTEQPRLFEIEEG